VVAATFHVIIWSLS